MHFTERFFNLMHYVLETASAVGPNRPEWALVAQSIEDLLKDEVSLSYPPGFTAQDRFEALCPIMLWIDERFLTSKRPDAEKWYDHCLQIKYFDTNQGGELFFRRLEDLLIRRRLLFDADLDLEPDKSHYLTYRLINLWHKPGEGPDPTEGLLDTFSLCLVLGYQGRYSNYDPSELATIKEPAIEQLQSWRTRTAAVSQPRVRRQSFFQWAAVTWRNHGWILLHLVLPAALLGWLFIKSREIIANLPF